MDANGARILRQRIAQQQHWERAVAVREGRQPPTDPHLEQLEAFHGDRRIYGTQYNHERMNGDVRLVAQRLVKLLREGEWVVSLEREGDSGALPPAS